jgi:hypothetical protein
VATRKKPSSTPARAKPAAKGQRPPAARATPAKKRPAPRPAPAAPAEQVPPSWRSTLAPGAHFAMPLADGRWGACRVLAARGAKGVLVENLDWLGPVRPALDDLRGVKALVLDHHAWCSQPNRMLVDEPPPPTFEPLGVVEPSADERATKCGSWGSWEALALHTVLQWRWHHDRKALLAEEAREAAERERRRQAAAEKKRRARPAK